MDKPKSSTTRQDYEQRMLRVLLHIQAHLDDALRLDELAAVAHFSPFHFHRIFRGMVRESVQSHVRRLRLERAAHRLKFTNQRVTHIAFEAGYEAHEAFTRAFRAMFDESPTEFRKVHRTLPVKPAPSGIHYAPDKPLRRFSIPPSEVGPMNVHIQTVNEMRVAFVRHIGPYDRVGEAWHRFLAWAGPRGLAGPAMQAFGVLYDDPDITPSDRLRYDACLTIDDTIEPEGEIGAQTVGGGCYAVMRHVGPYNRLGQTYVQLCGEWLPQSGRELRSAPALEFYRNSPLDTPDDKLVTDIFLPLED